MTGRCRHRGFVVVCFNPILKQGADLAVSATLGKVLWCADCGAIAVVRANDYPNTADWTLPTSARDTLTEPPPPSRHKA